MGNDMERSYAFGFTDGQEDIVDEVLEIYETSDNPYDDVFNFIQSKKKEIESL